MWVWSQLGKNSLVRRMPVIPSEVYSDWHHSAGMYRRRGWRIDCAGAPFTGCETGLSYEELLDHGSRKCTLSWMRPRSRGITLCITILDSHLMDIWVAPIFNIYLGGRGMLKIQTHRVVGNLLCNFGDLNTYYKIKDFFPTHWLNLCLYWLKWKTPTCFECYQPIEWVFISGY